MTRQDSATARQDRGYSPQSYRVVLAVTRSYGSYDDATLAGFTRRVGAAFVACLITAPVHAKSDFS